MSDCVNLRIRLEQRKRYSLINIVITLLYYVLMLYEFMHFNDSSGVANLYVMYEHDSAMNGVMVDN